ncbi:MAG: hypothetical protein NVSMB47_13930 [Polyangiales bacterium]
MRGGGGGAGVGAIVGGAMVLLVTIVIGAVMARMLGGRTQTSGGSGSAPREVYVEHGPPIDPSASKSAATPLAFNDPQNAAWFEAAKGTVAGLRVAVDAIPSGDEFAAEYARKKCIAADPELARLAGEPHPTVRELVDTGHRICDYGRPLSALQAQLARIDAAKKKKPGARPTEPCKKGEGIAAEIAAGHYQDDPAMVDAIGARGQLCL